MLRPKKMERMVIAGPKERLEGTIEILHGLKLVHITDFKEPDKDFKLGTPLDKAGHISESLVKLRSISSALQVEGEKVEEGGGQPLEQLGERISALEISINEESRSKKELEEQLRDAVAEQERLRPFASLGLPLEMYRGYRSLAVFVGSLGRGLGDIGSALKSYELFSQDGFFALFVHAGEKEKAEAFLLERNYQPAEVPGDRGDPAERLKALDAQKVKLEEKLEEVKGRLAVLRKKHSGFVLEAEELLSIEIEKAEAPLRFAATEHSFVVDGWVPMEKVQLLKEKLNGSGDIYVEAVETEDAEPPVELKNPAPAKPFEFLIHLFSTPSYKEIDPTFVVFLIFPIFFGFMIGDAGYGIVMILLGYLLWKKMKSMPALQELGLIFLMGGVFALLFGLFVYGEVFAIPFHPVVDSELPDVGNWSSYLGIEIPLYPLIHKLENIVDLLLLSVVGAAVHLGVGYLFGIVNEAKHDRKHALAKAGWLIILFALFIQFMLIARVTRVGGFFMDTVFYFVPWYAIEFSGISISLITVVLLIVGILMFVPAEGPMAVLEIIGLAANVLSYTRLAGIAVAKGAVALAFNVMLVPLLLGGNIAFIIMGAVFLFLAHALILILGSLAAGIQALRLNYVEFFLKFYKGNGLRFQPFGKPKVAG